MANKCAPKILLCVKHCQIYSNYYKVGEELSSAMEANNAYITIAKVFRNKNKVRFIRHIPMALAKLTYSS